MSSVTGAHVATAVLASQATANLYALFCPPISEVRGPEFHEHYGEHVTAIRHGYAAATAVVLPIGIASGMLVGSSLPFLGTLVVAAGMIAAYEHAIRHPAVAGHGWAA